MTPRTYDLLSDLPVSIDGYELEGRSRSPRPDFTRVTTTFHLRGTGVEGLGEDVNYIEPEQRRQLAAGAVLPLRGVWTLGTFAAHLDSLDLFAGAEPAMGAARDYRRWAIESAALDLALRQAGRPLHVVLDRPSRPLRFAVSLRLGTPPSTRGVDDRRSIYGDVRFKLDAEPDWDDSLIAALAATGAVDVIDFKGAYKGTSVDVETDPELYRRCAEAFPEAWLEDPDLTDSAAAAALKPHHDRITWDVPIHSIDDVDALAFAPRGLNSKPSRFGSLERLFDFYDACEARGIALYGGGQFELGVGRGQIQILASLFHPDGSNDVAPAGWDSEDFPRTGLAASPLDPAPATRGFHRA